MALQLIDLGNEVEVVEIDTSKVPYTFSVKLTDKTYSFTVKYNEAGEFFTVDLSTSDGEPLVYGDIVRYGRPLFGSVEDERFPLPVIIPQCLTGEDIDTVTFDKSSCPSMRGGSSDGLLAPQRDPPNRREQILDGRPRLRFRGAIRGQR